MVQSPEIAHVIAKFILQILFAEFDRATEKIERRVVVLTKLSKFDQGINMARIFGERCFQQPATGSRSGGFHRLIEQLVRFGFSGFIDSHVPLRTESFRHYIFNGNRDLQTVAISFVY